MRFDIKAFGLTCGILWGLTVFLVTLWLIAFGYQGTFIRNLDHFYFGYSFSLVGSVIGAIWGFVDGFIGGAVFAWLYNKLAKSPAT